MSIIIQNFVTMLVLFPLHKFTSPMH